MAQTARNMHNTASSPTGVETLQVGGPTLLGAGRYQAISPGPTKLLRQSVWVLEYFMDGRLEIDIAGNGWHRFEMGSGVLYGPQTPYRERSPDAATYRSVAIFFTLGLSKLFDPWRRNASCYWRIDDPQQTMRDSIVQVMDGVERHGAGELAALGALCHLLALLLASPATKHRICVTQDPREPEDLLAKAQRFMRANLHRSLHVRDVARHVGLSESGLAHAYRRRTGRSPMEHVRLMRVEVVKMHLFRGRSSLEQIAAVTGFADASHLSRTFRHVTGQSPREFRQGNVAEPAASHSAS